MKTEIFLQSGWNKRKTLSILLTAILLTAVLPAVVLAEKHVSGSVSGDWYASEGPYIVDDTIIVEAGNSLTIHQDTQVIFTQNDSLIVYGTLYIDATYNREVLFRMDNPTHYWQGIYFYNASSQNSVLKFSILEGCTHGVIISNSSPEIAYNSMFPLYSGIECFNSNSNIHDNYIEIKYKNELAIEVRGISIIQQSSVRIYNNYIDVFNGNVESFTNTYGVYCLDSPLYLFHNKIYTVSEGKSTGVFGWGGSKDSIVYNEIIVASEKLSVTAAVKLIDKSLSQLINNTIDVAGPGNDVGIMLDNASSTIILNNIIDGDGVSTGLNALNASPYLVQYNDFSNHQVQSLGWNLDDTNIFGDPMFWGSASPDSFYFLRPQSPCIDAGHPDPIFNDPDGTRNDMGAHPFEFITSVSNPAINPVDFTNLNCYPNPANSQVMISFSLSQPGSVSLKIVDSLGRLVDSMQMGYCPEGINRFKWDGQNATSGIYFIQLHTPYMHQGKKLALIK